MNFMNFISFIIKFIKFKPIIKFKKFELHNYDIRVLRHDKTHANNVKRRNSNNIQIIIYKKHCIVLCSIVLRQRHAGNICVL